MTTRRHLRTLLLFLSGLVAATAAPAQLKPVGDGGPGPVKATHLTAEMVSLGPAVAPGGTQVVGLLLTMEEKWHVYWINAGDSGEPPHIKWTLPEGVTAGPMSFPIPDKLPLGPFMDFGYEDTVAFPVTVSVASTVKPGPIHLDAAVDWLVCAQVCIPGKAHLGIDLTVAAGATPVAQEPRIGALGTAMNLIPKPLPAGAKFSVMGGKTDFVMTLTDGKREKNGEFYPFDKDPTDLIVNAQDQPIEPLSNGVRIRVRRSPDLTALPSTIHGVFKLNDDTAYDVSAPVVPGEAPIAAGRSNTGGRSSADVTVLGAVGLAFLGGIILNLMPCVFPVLFLKGLALVQGSGQERGHLRRHGIVYTLGILVSFWAIVAVLLILRATGSQAGWGFQLQSPTFIAILASFLFFFAMSLAGQFDLGLSLTSVGGDLAQKQGYAGSFFTGVLATVVATPCTAPLMGAAIGFALAQPAWITFAVFTALALGLALPYMLLSANPAWVRLLPRPGAWMETLKQFTAVPLFGTAIWLAWVYGRLYAGGEIGEDVDHLVLLLWCFLVLAIAGWVLGKWPAKWTSGIVAVVLIVCGLAIPLSQGKASTSPPPTTGQTGPAQGNNLVWQPYSTATLDAAKAAGHPVFIDFTAAWCLSCQFNERAVLKSTEVISALRSHNVTLIKADWTKYDPEITQQLASVGRSGVPTYVIYPEQGGDADILPELLTKDAVLAAIKKDTK